MSLKRSSISATDEGAISQADDHLALRAQEGCRSSFEELVRRFQVRLLRFLQRRVRSESDAEDLLQETFVRAFQRLQQYDSSRSFGTWLFTIAHRLAVSHHRHQAVLARTGAVLADRYRESTEMDPGQDLSDEEVRTQFWELARQVLTEDQMSAVWLFYVEDMSAPRIAEVLGRSWVSVKAMLFRAKKAGTLPGGSAWRK